VHALQQLGIAVGLGTDANVKPSILDEMRAASLLQKIARYDGSALGAKAAFDLGTSQGARALRVEAGDLREGAYADYAVVDLAASDPWIPLCNQIVYRAESAHVRETYVGGRLVRTHTDQAPPQAAAALRSLLPRLHL
jgi:5-methylthioadenosine/S-adenosylhomocysteine deaminase